jgi:GNAT superfamily N-acetyltransferase
MEWIPITMISPVQIRLARESDLDSLVVLYESVRQWLIGRGLDQWKNNTSNRIRDRIQDSIQDRCCFVAEDNGEIVGSITVDTFADPEFWHDDDCPEDALYAHRMVVNRQESGQKVGEQLLRWAEQLAKQRGKRWLRLDAWRTNTRLHQYYSEQGFDLVRIVELGHRGSGALFQKPTMISKSN